MIGVYEIDLSQVYLKPRHALLHQWIALSNPLMENFNDITGYLKLSVTV